MGVCTHFLDEDTEAWRDVFFTASLGSHDRSVGKYDQRWIGGRFATPLPGVARGVGLPEGRGKALSVEMRAG